VKNEIKIKMVNLKQYDLSTEQDAFLAKARRAAHDDEIRKHRPNYKKEIFDNEAGKLMAGAKRHGIFKIDPLLLADHYDIARKAAQRRIKRIGG